MKEQTFLMIYIPNMRFSSVKLSRKIHPVKISWEARV